MSAARPLLFILLACAGLSACTGVWTGSAGAIGLCVVGWLFFAARSHADAGIEADQGTAPSVDMGADAAALETTTTVCLCMAHPGAGRVGRVAVPGFDPVAIQARVRAILPADIQARLKD